mgnify:FL=1
MPYKKSISKEEKPCGGVFMKLKKILKRGIIAILIAVFSIAGFTSCKNKLTDATQSKYSNSVENKPITKLLIDKETVVTKADINNKKGESSFSIYPEENVISHVELDRETKKTNIINESGWWMINEDGAWMLVYDENGGTNWVQVSWTKPTE